MTNPSARQRNVLPYFCLILVIALVIISCKEDEEVKPSNQHLFELNISPDFYVEGTDPWVIISDTQGVLLGIQPVKSGDVISFDTLITTLPRTINVTMLTHYPQSVDYGEGFQLYTYAEVAAGSVWYLKNTGSITDSNENISCKVTLKNQPAASVLNFSSTSGSLYTTTGSGDGPTVYNLNWPSSTPANIFISFTGQGSPVYYKNANASGGNLDLDIVTDFKLLDQIFQIPVIPNLTGYSLWVYGYESEVKSYVDYSRRHVFARYFDIEPGIKVGYNNGYHTYETYWKADYGNKSVSFLKRGDAPELADFSVRDVDFTMLSTSLNNIDYTYTGDFKYCSNYWRYEDTVTENGPMISWSVIRSIDSKKPVLTNLPAELTSAYPNMSELWSKAKYTGSSFTLNFGDSSNIYSGMESPSLVSHPLVKTYTLTEYSN